MSMLRDYVKMMAYYKMNTFQIHLNDNAFKQYYNHDWNKTYSAFRLECETFPGLTARDGYYTKKEFIALQQLADSLGVEIIPEIDVPAHSLALTQYKPEIGSEEYGMDHLDLFKPETYEFVDALFREYLEGRNPVFTANVSILERTNIPIKSRMWRNSVLSPITISVLWKALASRLVSGEL